jgi:alkanesulfonate monooxygenase SsuD/methylene tetrahydromethanopterin reductase-like flavin-dependent oxidoreductase (luciferase family)
VKLDLFHEIDVPKPWPDGQRAAEQAAFKRTIEEVKLADRLGFTTAWFVEHHFREQRSHCAAPEVVIGALSQLTEQIRLGFGVSLMPHGFTHPIRVAEKVATTDVLSGGRIEWGTGRSTAMEQAAFGVPLDDEAREQWREAVETVVAAWRSEGDSFSWDGKYLSFPARPQHHATRAVVPKPVQDPHPPAWLAGVSPGSVKAAGAAGVGLLSFAILQPIDLMAEHIRLYREAAANPNPITGVVNNKVGAFTLVHCAESAEQAEANGAWDAVWWWYHSFAESTLDWDFREFTDEQKEALFPLLKKHADGDFNPRDFNEADMIIIGDVDECVEKMRLYAAAGVDHLLCYCSFGGMKHEAVMRNLELLGTEVLPRVKDAGVDAQLLLKRKRHDVVAPPMTTPGVAGALLAPGGLSSS